MTNIRSLAGLLVAFSIVQSSWQVPLHDVSSSETDDDLVKRHSEGTFTNDYSKYLEDRRAQDIVRWLMNNKRDGSMEKRHAEGTFTSDASSYLQDQAVRDFVAGLLSGQIRREWDVTMQGQRLNPRRHVDGSFTSDVNKVLDSMAAKEFLLWVMTSKSSGGSERRQADH
ncbi:pro-glucagon-like [Corythoichthys intestinalis]|uniref:pro-glucagon-like n=1 Tax=Corythoichthys intestinalis TaxID=161448 RepID=UPI0025A580EF|nr:pro-glucagon-like [Corythoichthys intestinalis]XP_061803123.1 pro-glucagon-like [Nerophis lumbriciformis]